MASRDVRGSRLTGIALPPFQSFLEAHRGEVRRFLMVVAGSNDADDCLQETFLAALRAYPRLRADSNLRAWVMTIAHRKAIDAARARRPVPVAELPEGEGTEDERLAAGEPELWSLVGDLPPKQRAAVAHRYVADLPYAQVAEAMGCSEEAARRSVHEGLNKLRERWAA